MVIEPGTSVRKGFLITDEYRIRCVYDMWALDTRLNSPLRERNELNLLTR